MLHSLSLNLHQQTYHFNKLGDFGCLFLRFQRNVFLLYLLVMKSQDRKERPVYTGVLKYFPDAIMEIAKCSYQGNMQHNPDKPLHWDRTKSGDELDALCRHLLQAGTIDTDGIRHSTKVAWRALANLQKELENK